LVTSVGTTAVVRHIEGSSVDVSAEIPDDWSELTVEGYVLVVGGRLDDVDGTMVPVVQVTLRSATDAEAVWQTLVDGAAGLPEAHEAFRARRPHGTGEEAVLEVVHRSPVTGGTQVSVLRTVFLPERSQVLSVVATCGGAATAEALDALRRIVASVAVSTG
jgi:hypothetical protein